VEAAVVAEELVTVAVKQKSLFDCLFESAAEVAEVVKV
jgi:hypothetical protein